MTDPALNDATRALLAAARRATLTTIDDRDGRPRSVPCCYAVVGDTLWSPLDEKPKASADPTALRRVRNLRADPRATLLVDRWDEDWARLAFAEIHTRGQLVEPGAPGHAQAVDALRARYPQYAAQRLEERPLLRFTPIAVRTWSASASADATPEPPAA